MHILLLWNLVLLAVINYKIQKKYIFKKKAELRTKKKRLEENLD